MTARRTDGAPVWRAHAAHFIDLVRIETTNGEVWDVNPAAIVAVHCEPGRGDTVYLDNGKALRVAPSLAADDPNE